MRSLVAALALACLSIPALSHSWYDPECCSSADCEMVASRDVQRGPDGWILPTGDVVPFDMTRDSLDGDFHWCRYGGTGSLIRPAGKAPCLYVPPGGV